MTSSGSTSPTQKIVSSSASTSPSPNSISVTKPLLDATPIGFGTSSAKSPPNCQSDKNKIELAQDATPPKAESKTKCLQDVGEIETVVASREETTEASKGNEQKEFDHQVNRNQRKKRKRGNRDDHEEESLPIGFV